MFAMPRIDTFIGRSNNGGQEMAEGEMSPEKNWRQR
jgi:hypothetical protein